MTASTHRVPSRLTDARRALADAASALGAPMPRVEAEPSRVPTGIPGLDAALAGGLPRGRVVELSGARSSGRMAFTLHLLAQAMASGEPTAMVDVADAMDPGDLSSELRTRVLWVRPTGLMDGLKAADVILDAGGFALVGLYLVGVGRRRVEVPSAAWARLAQRAERCRAVLLVVNDGAGRGGPSPGAFASLGLAMRRRRSVWVGAGVLDAAAGEVTVVRNRMGLPGAVVDVEPGSG